MTKYCVYCFLQERIKAKVRKPTNDDLKRCRMDRSDGSWKEPGYICDGCGAIFEKEYDKNGKLTNDEMKNLEDYLKR